MVLVLAGVWACEGTLSSPSFDSGFVSDDGASRTTRDAADAQEDDAGSEAGASADAFVDAALADADSAVDGAQPTDAGSDLDGLGGCPDARATARNDSELREAIDAAPEGGLILLDGSFSCLRIDGRRYTERSPLILRAASAARPPVITQGGCSQPIRVENSSYVVIDGVVVERRESDPGSGIAGVWVEASDHLIFSNLDVSGGQQEGIHIRRGARFVDILDSHVHDTGQGSNPQWGECIYLGTGGPKDFPDENSDFWVEGNELDHCGNGEAINVKPEVFRVALVNNRIHDIAPGANGQFNQAAITVEGGRPGSPYRAEDPREVRIERNTISDVAGGDWGNGIMVGGTGVYVLGNTIRNTWESGIYTNGFGDLGLFIYLHENTVDTSGTGDYRLSSRLDIRREAPPMSELRPQEWYCAG